MIKTYEASGKTVEDAIDAALVLAGTTLDNVDVEVLDLGGRGVFGIGKKDARVRISLEVPDEKPLKTKTDRPRSEAPPKAEPQRTQPAAVVQPKKVEPTAKPHNFVAAEPEAGSKQYDSFAGGRGNKPSGNEAAEQRDNRPVERDRDHKVDAAEVEALTAEAKVFLKPIFAKLQTDPEIQAQVKDGNLWLIMSGVGLGSLIGRRGETLNALQYLTNLALNKTRKDHLRVVLDVEGYRAGREETLMALAKKMADKAVRIGRRIELEPMNPQERRIVHIALQNDKRVDTSSQGEEPYRRVVISRRRGVKPRSHQYNRPKDQTQQAEQQAPSGGLSLSQQLAQQFDEQIDSRR